MNLQLIITKDNLNLILSGEKLQEVREIRPNTAKKYCDFERNGDLKGLKDFKSLTLHAGYAKNRPSVTVEVKNSFIEVLQDEDGKDLLYEHEGEEYIYCYAVYDLGKIVSRANC